MTGQVLLAAPRGSCAGVDRAVSTVEKVLELEWLGECRQTGPVVWVKLGPRTAYLICDPELVRRVLVDPEFDKGGPIITAARELLGNGLGTSLREDHRRQRRLMQPAFTQSRIDGYTIVMREEAARLAGSWTPHHEVDLMGDLTTTTLRVLIRTMLPTTDTQEVAWLAQQIRILFDGVFLRALTETTIILSAVAAAWQLRPTQYHRAQPRPPLSMTPARPHLTAEPRLRQPARAIEESHASE